MPSGASPGESTYSDAFLLFTQDIADNLCGAGRSYEFILFARCEPCIRYVQVPRDVMRDPLCTDLVWRGSNVESAACRMHAHACFCRSSAELIVVLEGVQRANGA